MEEDLGIVQVRLLNLDAERDLGELAMHGQARQDLLVADDGDAALTRNISPRPGTKRIIPTCGFLRTLVIPSMRLLPER
ncbi:hypothetical protein CLG94_04395 [Candidatus Methylomirabilis limnetica]|jgi:hypothetical protein|uniref:Uncharacterized protein n=1 Tax=Candidatus Methylomirabilis limnetica TaxID=2033718 RepID=A0A2T4TYX9_9BACT|nr:hypothetical protein CLG94_04395 [Candidatus Methylomirabilis limnetica]